VEQAEKQIPRATRDDDIGGIVRMKGSASGRRLSRFVTGSERAERLVANVAG
jgi:hypothetical protein